MFKKNDYVVYGASGVCKIMDVSTIDMMGGDKERLYYTLQPLNAKDSQIYTPVDNEKIIIRSVISKDEANELIDEITEIPEIWIQVDKLREEKFKEAIKSCDCKEWIKVIKTIYLRKQERIAQGKKITATDEKYFRMAEDHLYSELSVALDIEKNEIGDYIKNKIDKDM